jgi:hypothetical protein
LSEIAKEIGQWLDRYKWKDNKNYLVEVAYKDVGRIQLAIGALPSANVGRFVYKPPIVSMHK